MKHSEIRQNIELICNLFKLGSFKSFKTEKDKPIKGYCTAFFTVKDSETIHKYHFLNQ